MAAGRIKRRAVRAGGAVAAATALAASAPALARLTQAQLTATFKDRDYANGGPPPAAAGPACSVRFTAIVDERRSPEMAGVLGRRGVLAPQDRQAWLRAVLTGLARRGVTPLFDQDAAAGGDAVPATFGVRMAWIADSPSNYNAVVAVHLNARGVRDRTVDRDYRGRATRTLNWSGGVDTMQSAIDGAFADALDDVATDLKWLCGA